MADGTLDDYLLLDRYERQHAAGLGQRIIEQLGGLTDSIAGYQIDRLQHSLQSATRARLDGATVDWVVAALIHDIGDDLAPLNHSELAAAVIEPYVSTEIHWVIRHHGLFQTYYYAHHLGRDRHQRDRYRNHPWYDLCVQFCHRWDQPSFDPTFPTHSLDSFADDVLEVLSRPAFDPAFLESGTGRLV